MISNCLPRAHDISNTGSVHIILASSWRNLADAPTQAVAVVGEVVFVEWTDSLYIPCESFLNITDTYQ